MSFQKTVLIIALIVLSVMLFFIALAMRGLKKSQGYPPEIAECPDYWTKNPDGKCKRPDQNEPNDKGGDDVIDADFTETKED